MMKHYWIRGTRRADREAALKALPLPPVLAVLDAHRRLRGPYTAAGDLLRRIGPAALKLRPELGPRHYIEIATSTPELADLVPPSMTALEWRVGAEERTRYYSRLHTLNLANGLAEFVRDALRGPRTIVFENVHQADPTDQEFIAVLLRRSDLAGLTVVVNTGSDELPDPPGEPGISLVRELSRHALPIDAAPISAIPNKAVPIGAVPIGAVPIGAVPIGAVPISTGEPAQVGNDLAIEYLRGDCTSDDPRLTDSYATLSGTSRIAGHRARLTELTERAAAGESSLELGAIAFHAERAGDPDVALSALQVALRRCRGVGLYQAAADLGGRGRALVESSGRRELWWHFTDATAICLASLGRADEAEAMYAQAQAATQEPMAQMELAYGMAMLYARHYPEARRDFGLARAWMNISIAIASLLPDPKKRAFHSVFGDNGLALVEVRQNGPAQALRLLEAGIARLAAELAPTEQTLHRLVLRYNRAQVLGMLGRLEESLADYREVAEADPDFPEHHFNIGNILRRLGRNEEAIESFRTALTKSPPFPEAYYNLGDAELELGDLDSALADFSHAAQLEPDRVEAHVNRASLLYQLNRPVQAHESLLTGLSLAPANASLLSLQAQLLADAGEQQAARDSADAALAADPQLAQAWAIRAELCYQAGDLTQAVADFDRAVALRDLPEFRFNRAIVHQDAGRPGKAIADFEAVLAVIDDAEAADRLAACTAQALSAATSAPSTMSVSGPVATETDADGEAGHPSPAPSPA